MASGHSPRFPAILVVFFSASWISIILCIKKKKKTDMRASCALGDKMQLRPCSLKPFWMCFPSSLLRSCDWLGLLSVWRQPAGDLLCRWDGQLFDVYLSFVHFVLCAGLPRSSWTLLLLAGSRSASVIQSLPPVSTQVSELAGICWARVCVFRLSSSVYLRDPSKYTELPQTHVLDCSHLSFFSSLASRTCFSPDSKWDCFYWLKVNVFFHTFIWFALNSWVVQTGIRVPVNAAVSLRFG